MTTPTGIPSIRSKARIFSVSLDMLLQILRTFERLATRWTLVRLQWNVNANVRGDVISLDRRRLASSPLASQTQVVGTLPSNMLLADVILLSKSAFLFSYHIYSD